MLGYFGRFSGILGHFGIGAFWCIASRWGPRGRPPPMPQYPPTILISLITLERSLSREYALETTLYTQCSRDNALENTLCSCLETSEEVRDLSRTPRRTRRMARIIICCLCVCSLHVATGEVKRQSKLFRILLIYA